MGLTLPAARDRASSAAGESRGGVAKKNLAEPSTYGGTARNTWDLVPRVPRTRSQSLDVQAEKLSRIHPSFWVEQGPSEFFLCQ